MKKMGLLDKINLNLTDIEKKNLLKIVEGDNLQDIENITAAIENNFATITPTSEPIYQSDKTDSALVNKQFDDFYADLNTVYMVSNKIDQILSNEKNLTQSELKGVRNKLQKIKDRLDIYEIISQDKNGFNFAFKESFLDKTQFEQPDNILYIDPKNGRIYNDTMVCVFNNINECLTSGVKGEIIQPDIYIAKDKQTGAGFIQPANKGNKVENAITYSKDKVWSEVILPPSPLNVEYNDLLYYNMETLEFIKNGALCKIRLMLNSSTPLNTITINPFSTYPFEIVKIVSFPDVSGYNKFHNIGLDNPEKAIQLSKVTQILGPESHNVIQGPLIVDKPTIINFNQVKEAKIIEVAIRQKNYRISRYNITKKEIENIDILKELANTDETAYSITDADVRSITELDYYNRSSKWTYFKDLMGSLVSSFQVNKDIVNNLISALDNKLSNFNKSKLKKYLVDKNIQEDSNQKKLDINKVEYQYGLKEIRPKYSEYSNKSMFVSRLYSTEGNVKEVGIHSDDSIIRDSSKDEEYTIEYYVSNLKNPTQDDWYPILPEEYRSIYQDGNGLRVKEVLEPQITVNTIEASLRFKADTNLPTTLTDDQGNIIDSSDYTVFSNMVEINNTSLTLSNKILTIEYYIEQSVNPFIVDFDDVAEPKPFIDNKDGKSGELFTSGTDKNQMIELSYYPYIDYEKINDSYIDPEVDPLSDDLVNFNPNNYHFNPNYNYSIQNSYRPIVIEMEGQAEIYQKDAGVTDILEGTYYNDTHGIPYSFDYLVKENNDYVPKSINRNYNKTEYKPYFYNKTDYIKNIHPALSDYDARENPVFEYVQMGRKIHFNDSFNTSGTRNMGQIRVYYKYLVEGIRLKVIMKKRKFDPDQTPVVYSYKIKTRNFRG